MHIYTFLHTHIHSYTKVSSQTIQYIALITDNTNTCLHLVINTAVLRVCTSMPCQNGGSCTATVTLKYYCSCPVGYHGVTCQGWWPQWEYPFAGSPSHSSKEGDGECEPSSAHTHPFEVYGLGGI